MIDAATRDLVATSPLLLPFRALLADYDLEYRDLRAAAACNAAARVAELHELAKNGDSGAEYRRAIERYHHEVRELQDAMRRAA